MTRVDELRALAKQNRKQSTAYSFLGPTLRATRKRDLCFVEPHHRAMVPQMYGDMLFKIVLESDSDTRQCGCCEELLPPCTPLIAFRGRIPNRPSLALCYVCLDILLKQIPKADIEKQVQDKVSKKAMGAL